MYANLSDFITINGLNSVTILFNIISKKQTDGWAFVNESEGAELYHSLKQAKFADAIREVNHTCWQNRDEYLKDTCYSIRIDDPALRDRSKFKEILHFFISIAKKFQTPQIYINDQYEISDSGKELADFLEKIERQKNEMAGRSLNSA